MLCWLKRVQIICTGKRILHQDTNFLKNLYLLLALFIVAESLYAKNDPKHSLENTVEQSYGYDLDENWIASPVHRQSSGGIDSEGANQ